MVACRVRNSDAGSVPLTPIERGLELLRRRIPHPSPVPKGTPLGGEGGVRGRRRLFDSGFLDNQHDADRHDWYAQAA